MKKIILFLSISVLLISCAEDKMINGVVYRPYGLINEDECKVDSVHYKVSVPAVICGVVFSELIVPPIYVFGYNLYEPYCLKKDFKRGMEGIKEK